MTMTHRDARRDIRGSRRELHAPSGFRTPSLRLATLAAAVVVSAALVVPAGADVLFSNNNPQAVANGPRVETTISLNTPALVNRIMTYHWNGGRGTVAAGTISLRSLSGDVHGPWQASGLPGQGGVPNAYWEAFPTLSLPAGAYMVIDSDPASWAHNDASQGAGITVLEGYPQ